MGDSRLDILVFAAHPDDAELACSGTILKEVAAGKKVGICDLTKGEMGTRGSAEIRMQEVQKSSKILGLSARENVNIGDIFFEINTENTLKLVEVIRKYRPEIVLTNAAEDRHPDHGKGCEIAVKACFWAGLTKIETGQAAHRPKKVYQYIQDRFLKPDFVVDITDHWQSKLESIKAFSSQFYNPGSDEPDTYISSKEFWEFLEARGREMGHFIGAKYGEGFQSINPLEVHLLS